MIETAPKQNDSKSSADYTTTTEPKILNHRQQVIGSMTGTHYSHGSIDGRNVQEKIKEPYTDLNHKDQVEEPSAVNSPLSLKLPRTLAGDT